MLTLTLTLKSYPFLTLILTSNTLILTLLNLLPLTFTPSFVDGTVIYFLSFIMNQRYKHLGMLELVTFVICSNGIFYPYFSFVIILWACF